MLNQPQSNFGEYQNVQVGYGGNFVFDDLNLSIEAGKITAFCGPNGCGKSTALKTLCKMLKTKSGNVTILGEPIEQLKSKALARKMAMLVQSPSAPNELTVEQLVMLGRYSNRRAFSAVSAEDRASANKAIISCDLKTLAQATLGSLSGGQLQRAWIAMVIAQDAPAILLDEPTNHLDITHQLDTMELIKDLNILENKTIILVSHDLNLAARYADIMVLFKSGNIVAQGNPEHIMVPSIIDDVFGVSSQFVIDPVHEKPICIAYPSRYKSANP